MASITQTIPGFTSGISQQPDELMLPGQVKDLVNGLPDITDGLVKRSGSRFLAGLSGATSTGSWFSYYRDQSEGAYIGQVQTNGQVNMWRASDGSAVTVTGSGTAYLSHTSQDDLKFLTVADTTFVTNTTKAVQRTALKSELRGASAGVIGKEYQAFVELRQLAHGREYSFDVHTPTCPTVNITPTGGKALNIAVANYSFPSSTTISRGNGNYTGIDPALQHQGTEIFLAEVGQAKNLVFRLTVTGQVVIANQAGGTTQSDDYVGVYNVTAELLSGGYGWTTNQQFTVATSTGMQVAIEIKEVQQIKGKVDRGFFRPDPTSFDANLSISADGILSQVEQGSSTGQINLDVVLQIGNGIFLAHSSPFVVETKQPDLWRITPMEVNDPSELPRQCKHGMIVKVINSNDSQEDDYFLKFVGDGSADGPGRWEETIGPDQYRRFNVFTLPHTIQRQADGSFFVNGGNWAERTVGDNNTNPFLSFFSDETALNNNTGNKISQTFFHRNRLGFLVEDNVILSQAGDIYNLFQNSALVVAANDPIDIQASSTQPTRFIDSIETNTGVVIFSETQQFLLHTDSDTLTPETGKLSNISTYRYSPEAAPISLGTTIGFLDSAGVNGRFFEMFDIRREGEPQVIDQTKIVQTLLEHDTDIVVNSRENNTVFFSKSGTNKVHGYRYYNVGSKRVQSAWFSWEFPFNIEYAFVLDDALVLISSDYKLLEVNLQRKDNNRHVPGEDFYGEATTYKVHLDSSQSVTAGSYDSGTGLTTVTWSGTGTGTVAVVDPSDGSTFIANSSSGSTHTFRTDLSGQTLLIGYLYELKVELPKLYVKTKAADKTTADVTAALTIQRANLRFGSVGQIDVTLKRRGKPDYSVSYDSSLADWYGEDEPPVITERTVQVPVYERNHNVNITVKSTHPGPASFHSMTWEGDYTPMYHKRV